MKSMTHVRNTSAVVRMLGLLALVLIMIGTSITPVFAWDNRGHYRPRGHYYHGKGYYRHGQGYYVAPVVPVYPPPPPVVYAPPPPPPGISIVFPIHIR